MQSVCVYPHRDQHRKLSRKMRFYLFVCCLLIGHIHQIYAKNIAPTDDNPTSSPPKDGETFMNIQTKLLKIQDDIISITAAMGIAETLDNVAEKIEAIDKEFQNIKEEIATTSLQAENGECNETAKTLLFNQNKAVSVQLQNLQSSLKTYQEKRFPLDTIADIKAHRFEEAEQKLKQLKNYVEVSKIFSAIYANCSDNFEVLADLVENISDSLVIHFSVRSLTEEMMKNNHKNPLKWIRLIKVLEAGVINQPDVDYFVKQFAQFTDEALKNSLRTFTLQGLNASVSKRTFERNGELDNLTSAIYELDPLQSESIIEEFVNTNYGQYSSKKILSIITSHRFIQQKAKGITVLFSKIKENRNLNSDVIIKIAAAIHTLRSDKEFENLNKAQRDEVDKVIDNLPVCARNLFFLSSVCLWNKEKEEYLTASDLSSKYDNSRRNVFSTDPLPESHWYVNTTGDNFLFSSRSYDGEYFYAAAFNFDKDLRYVFNWIPGSNTDKQSEWSIELDGDYCYVKSAMYNEYLFSSNLKRPEGNNERYVFTWMSGHSVKEPKFQWQIRNCD